MSQHDDRMEHSQRSRWFIRFLLTPGKLTLESMSCFSSYSLASPHTSEAAWLGEQCVPTAVGRALDSPSRPTLESMNPFFAFTSLPYFRLMDRFDNACHQLISTLLAVHLINHRLDHNVNAFFVHSQEIRASTPHAIVHGPCCISMSTKRLRMIVDSLESTRYPEYMTLDSMRNNLI